MCGVKAHSHIQEKMVSGFLVVKRESPFDQVRGNSESLIKQINELSLSNSPLLQIDYIYTLSFNEKSIEWNEWELIDSNEWS